MATTSLEEDEQHASNDHSSAEVSNHVQKEPIQVNGLPVTDVSFAEEPDEKYRTPVLDVRDIIELLCSSITRNI